MARVTIVVGILLIVLGLAGYFGAVAGLIGTKVSYTALIPAGVGAPLLVLGLLALKDNLRKHAMHAAVMIGLLGFLGGIGKPIADAARDEFQFSPGVISSLLMAALCAVFVALCVRSFIAARRARTQRTAP